MRAGFVLLIASAVWASGQTMTEAGAALAGSTIGTAAGKKASEGITSIFEKVNQTTAKAAATSGKENKGKPLLEVGPGVPTGIPAGASKETKADLTGDVPVIPPPPPPIKAHVSRVAPRTPPPVPVAPVEPPPPAPQATPADLQTLALGTGRGDVLKLGVPVARITMFEDGHLLEIYRYSTGDISFGAVRLTDGLVSSVQVR